jgi:putative multiple sugar transport system substrate-binding protein
MKKLLVFMLSVIMVFTLAACGGSGSGEEEGEKKDSEGAQVGIVLPTKDEPRWLQDEKSFKSALGDAGFTSEVLFSQGDSQKELTNVETLVQDGVKVLVICPQDATAAAQAVKTAKDAGVKVVCYDRLITGTDAVDYYVTFNSFQVGVEQGQYLIDKYEGKKNVPLYLYSGAVTDNNAFIFFSGAWSVLTKAVKDGQFKIQNCDEIQQYIGKELDAEKDHEALSKILGTISTDWDFNKAKTLAESNLTSKQADAKGDVAILAPNDGTARAIADAFSADGDVKTYIITGQDAELASLKYIQDGKQSMTVWKNTATLAKTTCDMVSSILEEKEPETTAEYDNQAKKVPAFEEKVIVLDKDNLQKEIDAGNFDQKEIDSAK